MTLAETRNILNWFKCNVGLADWGVSVNELSSQDSDDLGQVSIDATTKTAKVWINTKRHEKEDGLLSDCEHTLLHELVHCFMADCGIEDDGGDRMEFFVNRLASVMLIGYRSK